MLTQICTGGRFGSLLALLSLTSLGCSDDSGGGSGGNPGGSAGAAGSSGAPGVGGVGAGGSVATGGSGAAGGSGAGAGGAAGGAAGSAGTGGGGFPACDSSADIQTVSFVHMNDMHGNYNLELTGKAKVAQIRGFYAQVKAENPYTLFTNGGDDYEKGSVAEALSEYKSTREVSMALRFDVRTIGNHDLAWSQEELLAYARDPHAVVLASNIDYIGNDPQGFGAQEYAEIQVGCIRIGFIGAVSAPWNEKNQQYQGDYYPEFPTDLDFIAVHRRLVDERRDDVDYLMVVSHLGVGDDLLVAEQVPGVDAVLGGHSHTAIAQPEVAGDDVWVMQAGSASAYVARYDVDFDVATKSVVDRRYELKVVTSDMVVDAEAQASVEAILDQYAPDAFSEIGRTKEISGKGETARLSAEGAVLKYKVDAALVQVDSVSRALKKGPLSQQNLFDAFLVERQVAGTPGWTAFHVVDISGVDLARLRDELDPGDWALVVPDPIDPAVSYELALQKFAAYNPAEYLPAGVSVSSPPRFGSEVWEALDAFARYRTSQCQYVDSDDTLLDCSN